MKWDCLSVMNSKFSFEANQQSISKKRDFKLGQRFSAAWIDPALTPILAPFRCAAALPETKALPDLMTVKSHARF